MVKASIKTFEQAFRFVQKEKVCTVFGSKCSQQYPSLWDHTDLSEEKPAEGGWSPKVKAVWDWKTRLPQTYPEQVFYGKVPGGDAALMDMRHFREQHFPNAYRPVSELSELAQGVFELVRQQPGFTGALRKLAIERYGCSKSQFDTALKHLQISLNVVRSNDPKLENDFWLPMSDVHWELVRQHTR